ncbi:MAG: ABC transporter permease, partial [Saprospiraceae bacterium]
MWTNQLKIALRNFRRQGFFSLLNVSGLSIGLAVTLLIGLYVRDEWSFDRFNEKADRIYRANIDVRLGGQEQALAVACAPMGPALLRDYPAVETMCRFRQLGFITVKKGNEAIEEGNNSYVDSTFFSVFTLPLVEGDPQTALTEPGTGVISEKMALKYFGSTTGVVGRSLRINENRDMRVTGVLRDMPAQSHFHYNFLFSMSTIPDEANSPVWLSNNFQTYLLLRPGASASELESHFPNVVSKYVGPQLQQVSGSTIEAFQASGGYLKYSLIKLRDIHLHSDRTAEHEANSDVKYVWIFSLVALLVLLLACVNFMNLSTARSAGRAREVGVRKALGSNRGALIRQFLAESLVLTGISFALALVFTRLALPTFNDFAAKEIRFSLLDAPLLGSLAGLAVITAFVAGAYPAFFLSAFRPIEVLKGKPASQTKNSGATWLRSGLVVFQFFISVGLIASVLVVQKQLAFIQQKKLGYDKEHLVMLRNTWYLHQKTGDFKARLLQIPGVQNVSATDYFPTPSSRNSTTFNEMGKDLATQSVSAQRWEVDFDYLPTFGLQMQDGRWFDASLKTDSSVCVINQSMAKVFGWPDPLGRKISLFTDPEAQKTAVYEVVGVVQDF